MRLGSRDIDTIDRIMNDPDVFDTMKDDHNISGCVDRNVISTLLTIESIYLLHPTEHSLFMVITRTNTVFEVHTMILPEGRGSVGVTAAKEAAVWLFENTTCEKIITHVPEFNRPALIFAKRSGMKVEGVLSKSFKRNGVLMSQTLLGLNKEDVCLQ